MSAGLVESPVSTSQLYFSWSEPADISALPSRNPPSGNAIDEGPKRSKQAVPPQRAARVGNAVNNAPPLSFNWDQRIEKPVHIGAVMIQLLKRYGISDQEIEEGIANYASKTAKF